MNKQLKIGMTEGWMCIVAKETWERKYQTCHILSLLAAVIVNYICKICSGDTFLDPSIPLFHISIHLCIQNFAMNVLDISFFFFFAKTICTSRSKWMSSYSYSHPNMLEALPLLYCYSHHTLWKNVCPVLSTGHCEFLWVLCAQSGLTICDLMAWSPLDFPVCRIFQARILAWVAISSSRDLSDLGTERLQWQGDSLPQLHLGHSK